MTTYVTLTMQFLGRRNPHTTKPPKKYKWKEQPWKKARLPQQKHQQKTRRNDKRRTKMLNCEEEKMLLLVFVNRQEKKLSLSRFQMEEVMLLSLYNENDDENTESFREKPQYIIYLHCHTATGPPNEFWWLFVQICIKILVQIFK